MVSGNATQTSWNYYYQILLPEMNLKKDEVVNIPLSFMIKKKVSSNHKRNSNKKLSVKKISLDDYLNSIRFIKQKMFCYEKISISHLHKLPVGAFAFL